MAANLKARLERIRISREQENRDAPDKIQHAAIRAQAVLPCANAAAAEQHTPGKGKIHSSGTDSGWEEAGREVLRRTMLLPFAMPALLPEPLPILVPDLLRARAAETGGAPADNAASNMAFSAEPIAAAVPPPEQFLFFDLETTGLSGGAGTVAFLTAFGRFVRSAVRTKSSRNGYTGLEITQFLLLDYPGETDFLEQTLAVLSSFGSDQSYFLTTYNGKAFDVPLIKTRCLMNGMTLPQFRQADLLHPARRLWKRMLPNCSQATVETEVLNLDRSGDTPGAMAPDIWFNFLRSGAGTNAGGRQSEAWQALMGICDHNVKDIFGLASLFRAFTEIAASPESAAERFSVDEENLAMRWRHFAGQKPDKMRSLAHQNSMQNSRQQKTAALLLQAAAEQYPKACLRYGFDLFREDRDEEARAALRRIETDVAWRIPCTAVVKALALRSLAIDAERRLGRKDTALACIERAASMSAELPLGMRDDLEKRRTKLCGDSPVPC